MKRPRLGAPKSDTLVYRFRGAKIVGVFTRLEGVRRQPAVLFLHGFPGAEKNVDIQRRLLEKGVASLALHFRGAWGSGGEYRLSNLLPDAREGLKRLSRLPGVDPRRLGVFGFSMGGWAALNLAAAAPSLRAVAAVAPVGGPELLGRGARARVAYLARPLTTPPMPAFFRDFEASLERWDAAVAASKRRMPLLLVQGTADDVVPRAINDRIFASAAAPKERWLLSGARHDFLDRREALAGRVARWLASRI